MAVGCQDDGVKGYVGDSSGGGSPNDPASALIVVTPNQPIITLTEGGAVNAIFSLNKPYSEELKFSWEIETDKNDFLVGAGEVTVSPGDQELVIPIYTKSDTIFEGTESHIFKVFGDPSVIYSSVTQSIRISESLTPPLISFSQPTSIFNEGGGIINIAVNMIPATSSFTRIAISTSGSLASGSDYTFPINQIVFAPGVTQTNFQVVITDDIVGESVEDLVIKLETVTSGDGSIDLGSDTHTLLITDNDFIAPFDIRGVTGGSDTSINFYLTNGLNPVVQWSDAASETGYDITIYENNGITVKCPTESLPSNVVSHNFSSCVLTEGQTYKIGMTATISGIPSPAGNNMIPFTVDTLSPSAFEIVGVLGGIDVDADNYLSGSLYPTITWTNSSGEASYQIAVFSDDNTTVICPEKSVPANALATSYSDACSLVPNKSYKVRVKAVDSAGNESAASNSPFSFLVTDIPSGYIIRGVAGGAADSVPDDSMGDGDELIVSWEDAIGEVSYDVTVLENDGISIKCPRVSLPADQTSYTFLNCRFELHQQYKVRVIAYDVNGNAYPAANSPYQFRNKAGLYISGTGGSYYKGIPITVCGGAIGDVCSSATPYVSQEAIVEKQIRISNNGFFSGASWTAGASGVGNGLLSVTADWMWIESGSQLSMIGRGHSAGNGASPGAVGYVGAEASGGAYGAYGGRVGSLTPSAPFGDLYLANALGSPGGNSPNGSLGGNGGGRIRLIVNETLYLNGEVNSNGANGTTGANGFRSGGGSGGGIWLDINRLEGGGGRVQSNGGNGSTNAASGSGGRIAVYYNQASNYVGGIAGLRLEAFGGTTVDERAGGAGTTYYKNKLTDTYGHLIVDNGSNPHNQGSETMAPVGLSLDSWTTRNTGSFIVPAGQTFDLPSNTLSYRLVVEGNITLPMGGDDLIIANGGYLEWRKENVPIVYDTIDIQQGGILTHSRNYNSKKYWLEVQANQLKVGGILHANHRGYQAETGPGAGLNTAGGAFGGESGPGASNGGAFPYDLIKNPSELGSGGGWGPGGGYLRILVGILELSGVISSDGDNGMNCKGGGSGGSIAIIATEIKGSGGSIRARGGSEGACATTGGGSGGRVAVLYTTDSYVGGASSINFDTTGGDGGYVDGASGTVYRKHLGVDTNGHLRVDNGIRTYSELAATSLLINESFDSITTILSGTIKIPTGLTFTLPSGVIDYRLVLQGDLDVPGAAENLTIAKGGYVELRRSNPVVLDDLTINVGGLLTHTTNYSIADATAPLYAVNIDSTAIKISGNIDVSSRGCYRASCQGMGTSSSGNSQASGAGHGGYGGFGDRALAELGHPYGSINVPLAVGSGGGNVYGTGNSVNYNTYGGAGGGLVILNSTNLELNGLISVNGGDGEGQDPVGTSNSIHAAGGGSAGSIYISTTNFSGIGGRLTANGGVGGYIAGSWGGSGAGGRVSLSFTNDSYSGGNQNLTVQAYAGVQNNSDAGAAGSVYVNHNGQDRIIVDNNTNPHVQFVETPVPTGALLFSLDELVTRNNGTLVVEALDTFTVHTNPSRPLSTIDYRLVVAGTLVIPGGASGNLTIANMGLLEWRRGDSIVVNDLTIQGGGVLTHSQNNTSQTYLVDVTATNFNLAGGKINANYRGYAYDYGPSGYSASDNGGSYGGKGGEGYGTNSVFAPYGDLRNPSHLGHSRGGRGGGLIRLNVSGTSTINGIVSADGETSVRVYGVNAGPFGGGSGGGIYLNTNILAGSVGGFSVNGGSGDASRGGGGSGGRVAVFYSNDQTVAGAKNLNLSGYGGFGYSHGAAGTIFLKNTVLDTYGHIVVRNSGRTYWERINTPISNEFFDSIITDSGTVIEVPVGTTFTLPSSNLDFRLILTGDLAILGGGSDLAINNRGILEFRRTAPLTLNSLTVNVGGTVTHSVNGSTISSYVNLDLTNLNLNGGTISASEKGYSLPTAGTPGSCGPGGGHGGSGGKSSSGLWGGSGYGLIKNPSDMGSIGGNCFGWTYPGGGRIQINTNNLILNGSIVAHGGNGTGVAGGTGGGSINITVQNQISGATGYVGAKGGQYYNTSYGCGGGGRIAIRYLVDSYQDGIETLPVHAEGGTGCGARAGGAGTIFIMDSNDDVNGHLFISNGENIHDWGAETTILQTDVFDSVHIGEGTGIYIPSGVTFDFQRSDMDFSLRNGGTPIFSGGNLVMKSYGKIWWEGSGTLALNNLTMENGSWITHNENTTSKSHFLKIDISNDFTMYPGSQIDVSGKGYQSRAGPGKGADGISTNHSGGGGGHGGNGGNGGYRLCCSVPVSYAAAGVAYDLHPLNSSNPVELGSGGGVPGGVGAGYYRNGGGAVLLTVGNTFHFEGSIYANGENGVVYSGNMGTGGGAGGTVHISAQNLSGALGVIEAKGGNSNTTISAESGGSGGGGIIRLNFTNDFYSGTWSAIGVNVNAGASQISRAGQNGIVYVNP